MSSTATPAKIEIRKPNQHGAAVLVNGLKRYRIKPGQAGYFLHDLYGNKWFHWTRDEAISTVLRWHW